MKEKFKVNMTKEEMLEFYKDKIIRDGIDNCLEFSSIISLKDYDSEDIKLENYKDEIWKLIQEDDRVADVYINDEFYIDMVFYIDYCQDYDEDYDEDYIEVENEME